MDEGSVRSESKKEENSYKIVTYKGHLLDPKFNNMIYAKWLRSLRRGNDYFKLIYADDYFQTYYRYIKSVLERPTTEVRLAVLTDDSEISLGFCVYQPNTLHYIEVGNGFRKQGIARSLVPFSPEVITHLTKTGMIIWNKHMPHAKFNPFI